MAAKSKKLSSLDDYELDDGLDIPDYNFDFDEPKQDQNPVLSTIKEIGKGALGSVFNKGIIRSTIKHSLPESYGTAYDFYDRAKETARSLYNDAARELRPASNQLKQVTRRILPQTEGVLPDKIGNLLKEWSKAEQQSKSATTDSIRADTTAMEIGEIFKAQAEDLDRRAAAQDKREQFNQGIEQIRHRDLLEGLSSIDINTSRLAAYQDSVLAGYQKKSLELQFRQYYATADILAETRKKAAVDRLQLEAIVKNTGLPDYAKLRTSDAIKQATRNKFLDGINNTLFGGSGGPEFIQRYIENIKKSLSEKLQGGASTINGLGDALDMATQAADTVGDMGGSKAGLVGGIAGGLLGDYGVGKAQDYIGKKLKANPNIQRGAEKLQYGMNNFPNIVSDYLNDPSKSSLLPDAIRDFLQDNLPSNKPDTGLDILGLAAQNQPAVYSNAAQKSIVEVIPGLLSRIQRELVITRTGKNSELITYDWRANKFSTERSVGRSIVDSFATPENKKAVDDRLNQLLGRIDPRGTLSQEDLSVVKDKLLDISVKRGSTDPSVLVNPNTFRGAKNPRAVAQAFQAYLRADEDGKLDNSLESLRNRNVVSDSVAGLTKYFGDPRAELQEMARLGQLDALEASGLYDRKNKRLDLTKIAQALRDKPIEGGRLDESFVPVTDESESPAERLRVSRRRNEANRLIPDQEARPIRQVIQVQAPASPPPPPIPPSSVRASTPEPTPNVQPMMPTVNVDTSGLLSAILAQTTEIQKLDHGDTFKRMLEELMAINANLEAGINTYSLTEDLLGADARSKIRQKFSKLGTRIRGKASDIFGADARQRYKDRLSDLADAAGDRIDQVKKKFSLRDVSLGDIGDAATGLVTGAAKRALPFARRAGQIATTVATGGFSLAKDAISVGSQKAADFFGDIYVEGENTPRLTYGRMKAGMYFDKKSGKVITSLKDLQGDVVNQDGSETYLTADEIKKSYIRGKRTVALKEALTQAGSTFKDVVGFAASALGGFYGTALTLAVKGVKTVVKLLPPYDVYVKTDMTKPRLFAYGFKNGEYFSKKTGKVLAHPRDIDGPVVDKDQNELVSDDNIQVGLVDVRGLTVTNKVARLIGKVKGLASGAIDIVKGLAGNAKEFLVGIGQAVKDIFGGVFGLKGEYLQTSMKQLDVQMAILKLLTERMPERKRVLGDSDGDGIREGSAEDLREKAVQAKKAATAQKDNTANSLTSRGGIFGKLAGLFAARKKKQADKEEGEDDDGYGLADALGVEAAKSGLGKAWAWAKGKGLKGLGKIGLKGAGLAGAAYGAYSAYDNIKQGNYGEAALDTAGAGAGLALSAGGVGALGTAAATAAGATASGVGGAATAIGTGAAALGTGLLAVLTSPITLTALGVAAVGAGAYFGYKYLTRAKLNTLSTVRYAQYGFPSSDTEHLSAIFQLEEMLLPSVKMDGDKPSLNADKLNFEQLLKPFNVKPRTPAFNSWWAWFNGRFKPVYLAHLAVLQSTKPGVKLSDVDDKLTAQEKLQYLEATSMPTGPFDLLTSPFPELANLTISGEGVRSAVAIARQDLQEQAKKEPNKLGTNLAAGAATATGVAAANTLAAKSAQAAPGNATLAASQALELEKNKNGFVSNTASQSAAQTLSVSNTVPSDYIFTGQTGRIDALTTVRFKTYGLVQMDLDKIKAIRQLEIQVSKTAKIGKDGVTWENDVEDLLDRVKGVFGISGIASPRGLSWLKWFRNRFLPVFLNYQTMVIKLSGKKTLLVEGEMALTTQQQLDTANAVYTTSVVVDGSRISVWKVTDSPFMDYALNIDEETVKPNLQFLTEAVKGVKLGEQMSTKVREETAANQKAGAAATDASGRPNPTAVDPNANIKNRARVNADEQKRLTTANGFIQPTSPREDGVGVRGIGDFTGGTPVQHPGRGTGGDINSIPAPTGNSGWEAMKEMFQAVSKVTGVPLSTLAAVSAIESNFKADAMPPINPATGKRASGAIGLFQFIPSTWNNMLQNYGAKYGIAPGTPATDPRANALMGAEYLKENLTYLEKKLKRKPTVTDLYLAHFLGSGGAVQFLTSNPNDPAADTMPKPAAANESIFYDKRRNGAKRTFAEIYGLFNEKVNQRTKQYNINAIAPVGKDDAPLSGSSETMATPSTTPAATPKPTTPAAPAKTDAATGAAALVASSSTPAPAPTPSTSGYGGSINRTRGEAGPATDAAIATAAASSAATPAAPTAPPVVRAPANYRGFNPQIGPTPDELKAQASAATAALGTDVKTIAQTLATSLQVQQLSLEQLRFIANNLGKPTAVATTPASNDTPTSTSGPARTAPAAPVSMARKY